MSRIPAVSGVIYALSCSCHPDAGIRYVGLTTMLLRERVRSHISLARNGGGLPVSKWIRKHGENQIVAAVLEECGDKSPSDLEVKWIADLKASGASLLNMTSGGFGFSNPEEEARIRLSQSMKARNGRHDTPEYRARISAGVKRSYADGTRKPNTGVTWSKLTEAQVMDIIARSGKESCAALALEMGVNPMTVLNVIKGKTWKHIDRTNAPPKKPRGGHSKHAPEAFAEAARLRLEEGLSYEKVTKITGIDHKAVKRYIQSLSTATTQIAA